MTTSATRSSEAVAAPVDHVVQGASPGGPGVVAGITNAAGTVYLGVSGVRDTATGTEMTTDTVMAIFSTTKAITGLTALQLLEEGELDVEAPASDYVPALGQMQVLDGFDDAGQPVLRAPRTAITTKHLLLHTAGFADDFFTESYHRMATDHGQPSIVSSSRRALQTPLLFDPGTNWAYGSSIDGADQYPASVGGHLEMETAVYDALKG